MWRRRARFQEKRQCRTVFVLGRNCYLLLKILQDTVRSGNDCENDPKRLTAWHAWLVSFNSCSPPNVDNRLAFTVPYTFCVFWRRVDFCFGNCGSLNSINNLLEGEPGDPLLFTDDTISQLQVDKSL